MPITDARDAVGDVNDPDALWKRIARSSFGSGNGADTDGAEMLPHDRPIGDFPSASGDATSSTLSPRASTAPEIPDDTTELEPRSNSNPTATGGKTTANPGQPQTLEDYVMSAPANAAAAAPRTRLAPTDTGDDLPDVKTMPGYSRMTQLNARLDKAQAPPTLKQRLIRMAITMAPTALGAAFGGLEGAGAAAQGTSEAIATDRTQKQHDTDDLIRQVDQSGRMVDNQYGHILHSRDIAANRDATAAYRQATIQSANSRAAATEQGRSDRSDQRSSTQLRLHGLDADGNPLPMDQLSEKDKAGIQHQKNQDELVDATTALRKAQTDKIPADIENAKQRLLIARQHLADSAQRLALQQRGMDLREEGLDWRETGATAATQTKVQQAGAIQDVGTELIKRIRANKDNLGPISGRITNVEQLWGNIPKEAAELGSYAGSFAALLPGLHQMRGTAAMKDFETRLQAGSFKTYGDAMEAAVQAMMDSAGTMKKAWQRGFTSTAGNRRRAQNNQPLINADQNVVEFVRGKDGKIKQSPASGGTQ